MSEEVQFSIQSIDGRYSFVIAGDTVCGRDSSCEAVIPESSLSRRHARFYISDRNLHVEDLGSTNGTFVNGEQLHSESRLVRYNDIVRFDLLEFKVFVELASKESGTDTQHIVAAAKARNEPRAPRSWAVNEEVGQGTVVMDLGASKRSTENRPHDVEIDSTLLQSVDQPSLIGIRGVDQGKVITLAISEEAMTLWQLGRSADMDIVIDDPSVSEHQAQIIFEQGTWKMVDVISTNASYVNDEKILTHYLTNGDTLRFGAAEYLFRISSKTDFRPRTRTAGKSSTRTIGLGLAAILLVALSALYFFSS